MTNDKSFNKTRVEEQFWISRTGRILKYKGDLNKEISSLHYEIAIKILPYSKNPEDLLLRQGCIKIGSYVGGVVKFEKQPSQAQINTMDKLGFLHHLKLK